MAPEFAGFAHGVAVVRKGVAHTRVCCASGMLVVTPGVSMMDRHLELWPSMRVRIADAVASRRGGRWEVAHGAGVCAHAGAGLVG